MIGSRQNLIAYTDDPGVAGLMFFCHMDTVNPKASQLMDGKMQVNENDGKMFGLGTIDMKGGMAALLSSLSKLSSTPRNLVLVFYCDEEFDFLGMKKIIAEEKFKSPLAVFTEPTDLKIANGCRGLIEFSGIVKGFTAHPSRELHGLNAILLATRSFDLWRMNIGRFAHEKLGLSSANLASMNGGLFMGLDRNENALIGRDGNNIPDYVEVVLEVRTSSSDLNAVKAIKMYTETIQSGGGVFTLKKIRHDLGSFFSSPELLGPVEDAIADEIGTAEYSEIGSSGYYDAQMVAGKFGIPCVSFGPGPKSTSHKEDEHIDISSLEKSSDVYASMIRKICI